MICSNVGNISGACGDSVRLCSVHPQFASPHRMLEHSLTPKIPCPLSSGGGFSRCSLNSDASAI